LPTGSPVVVIVAVRRGVSLAVAEPVVRPFGAVIAASLAGAPVRRATTNPAHPILTLRPRSGVGRSPALDRLRRRSELPI
jgi:hypothetical protein